MIEAVSTWVEQSGPLVYVLSPAFTFVVAVLPVPAEIPAAINGMVFGPLWGTAVTWSMAMAGAQVSFELARRYGRPLGRRLLPEAYMARADALVRSAGWPALLVLRLVPTVAFTAVNWAAGLTLVRRSTFVWTTAVGILPGAFAFTASGSGVLALARRYGMAPLVWVAVALLGGLTVAFILARWRPPAPGAR